MKQIFSISAILLLFCVTACRESDPFVADDPVYMEWGGDTSHFEESASGGMSLNSLYTSGEATVYMPAGELAGKEYKFTLTMDLNPSSRNYARVYLWSESPDTSDPGEAFFVRLGYTKDNVSLCYQTGNKTPKVLINGADNLLTADWSEVSVRVIVEETGTFHLFTRMAGEEEYKEGESTYPDPLPAGSGYFMLNCKFTSKGRNAFAFDSISVDTASGGDTDSPDDGEDPPVSDVPALLDTRILSSTDLLFVFDRAIDSKEAVFTLSGKKATRITPASDKKQLTVTFGQEMEKGKNYQLVWKGIKGEGGTAEATGSFDFIFSEEEPPLPPGEVITDIHAGDVVINEILFDPFAGGSEYMELYNRTTSAFDVSQLAFATRKEDGTLRTAYPLSGVTQPLLPGGYLVFTKQKAGVLPFYTILSPETICEVSKLPVLSNQSATLVLFDVREEEVVDEVSYSSKWHAVLAGETKGVSLERLSPDRESQDAANWTSAAANAGYGTPGYKNSQSETADGGEPKKIRIGSPVKEKEGYTVAYTFDQAGYLCKSVIYDTQGRAVAEVGSGESLGTEGILSWNGKRKDGKPLRPGLYIWYADFIHPSGKAKRYKETFVAY